MKRQQQTIVDELLEGAYKATTTEDLLLHLRTATAYVEGVLALDTEDESEAGGVCRFRYVKGVLSHHAEDAPKVIVLIAFADRLRVLKELRAAVPGLDLKTADAIIASAPIVLAPKTAEVVPLIDALRTAGAKVVIRPAEVCTGIPVARDVYQHFEGDGTEAGHNVAQESER